MQTERDQGEHTTYLVLKKPEEVKLSFTYRPVFPLEEALLWEQRKNSPK